MKYSFIKGDRRDPVGTATPRGACRCGSSSVDHVRSVNTKDGKMNLFRCHKCGVGFSEAVDGNGPDARVYNDDAEPAADKRFIYNP